MLFTDAEAATEEPSRIPVSLAELVKGSKLRRVQPVHVPKLSSAGPEGEINTASALLPVPAVSTMEPGAAVVPAVTLRPATPIRAAAALAVLPPVR